MPGPRLTSPNAAKQLSSFSAGPRLTSPNAVRQQLSAVGVGPRLTSPNAAKQLSSFSAGPRLTSPSASAFGRQARHLHMTAAATSPTRIFSTEKPITDIASLKAESQQLATTLAASTTPSIRHINTTCSLHARNDSSTIDFMFFPQFTAEELSGDSGYDASFRVPRLPLQFFPPKNGSSTSAAASDIDAPVQRTIISTTSGDASHISSNTTLSEVHDASSAEHLDFEGMVAKLSGAAEAMAKRVEEESPKAGGIVRQVWSGLLDDLFGAKKGKA